LKTLILGAGGLGREVYFHLLGGRFSPDSLAFFDEFKSEDTLLLDGRAITVFRSLETSMEFGFSKFIVGVGDPIIKKSLVTKALSFGLLPADTFIHPSAQILDRQCKIGRGGVVCAGAILTTNISVGDYVVINFGVTVGHDAEISSFVTINPNASISGNTAIGESCLIGTCACLLQGRIVGAFSTVGAGSVVTKDIAPNVTVVGIPAKQIVR